jgi:hypothetical protein
MINTLHAGQRLQPVHFVQKVTELCAAAYFTTPIRRYLLMDYMQRKRATFIRYDS